MTSRARVVDRIACPSALSVPVWLLAFTPSVTTAVLHDRNLFGGSLLAWLTAALAGAFAAGAVLALAALLLRSRRPLLAVLIVFVLAGAMRGMGVGATAEALGLVTDPQYAVRAISGAILGIFWLSIATVLVDGFRRHRRTREELDLATESAERDLARAQADLQTLQSRMQSDVIAQVGSLVRDLEHLPREEAPAREELLRAATRLHDLASTVVRPISHEAHVRTPGPVPERPSRGRAYRAIAVDAVTVDPFRPDWLVLLLLPSILMTAVRAYGPVAGLLGAVSIVALPALVLLAARHVITPRLHRWRRSVRALVVVAVWLLAALAASLPVAVSAGWSISPERSWPVFGVPLLAYVPVTCLGIAIGTAIGSSWALDADMRASRIASLTWQARLDEQRAWATRQQWGRFLHGSVQSTLTSTALVIQMQASQGAPPAEIATNALTRLRPVLQAAATDVSEPSIDVEDVLGRIIGVWSRIATITLTTDNAARAALAREPSAAERVVEISREALANAVRHGHARAVCIDVACTDAAVVDVIVMDDGQPAPTSAGQGLGSRLLDEWCVSWRREPTPTGGTVLACRVALSAGATPHVQPA